MHVIETAPAAAAWACIANGIELGYQAFGEHTAAPPLLLVMGMGGWVLDADDGFCHALAGRGFRVIRFDTRDGGRSTRMNALGMPDVAGLLARAAAGLPLNAPYLLADLADDGIGLLDALGIGRAHLVGVSTGGMIAQEVALRHPARVRSLTSIMSCTGPPMAHPGLLETLTMPAPADWPDYLAHHRIVRAMLGSARHPLDPQRGDAVAQRLYRCHPGAAAAARQWAALFASTDRRTALQALRAPALVIHGSDDPWLPMACGVDTAQAIPGASLQIVEGMGHALPCTLWPQVIDSIAAHAGAA